jgi:hypothetical protein
MVAATASGDQRFAAVRPLALLREHHALVMDHVAGRSVRQLVHTASWLNPGRPLRRRPAPESVLPAVGAWLRLFHDGQPTASYPVRQATGREVEAHFAALEDFLGRRLGRGFGRLAGVGSGLAGELLPPGQLPVVVGHGDFAPRNVMVDQDARVVVLDPQPRWAVPVHEDLCRFLVGLQLLGLQTHTRGLALATARLTRWQDLVIAGYHGGAAVPEGPLRCYQLLVLLDKWSALVDQPTSSSVRGRARRRLLELGTGYVRAQAEQLAARARAALD